MRHQPVGHAARLHALVGLLGSDGDISDWPAEHLRVHLGEGAVGRELAGKVIGLARMRLRVEEDARTDRAGVEHVDRRPPASRSQKGSTILLSVLIEAAWPSIFCMNVLGLRITHLMLLALSRSLMVAWLRPTTDSESALAAARAPLTRTRYSVPTLSAASSTLFCCSTMLGLCPVTTNSF